MKWKYGALRSVGWSMSRRKHFSLFSNLDLPPSAYAIRREPKRSAKCHIQLKFYVLEEWASLYDAVRFAFIVVFARLFSSLVMSMSAFSPSPGQNRIWFRVDKHFHVQLASLATYNWHSHPLGFSVMVGEILFPLLQARHFVAMSRESMAIISTSPCLLQQFFIHYRHAAL